MRKRGNNENMKELIDLLEMKLSIDEEMKKNCECRSDEELL